MKVFYIEVGEYFKIKCSGFIGVCFVLVNYILIFKDCRKRLCLNWSYSGKFYGFKVSKKFRF